MYERSSAPTTSQALEWMAEDGWSRLGGGDWRTPDDRDVCDDEAWAYAASTISMASGLDDGSTPPWDAYPNPLHFSTPMPMEAP